MLFLKKHNHPRLLIYAQYLPLILIMCWLVIILPLYLPNMGGSGLKLPVNIVAWGVMAAITATIWISYPCDKPLLFGTTTRFIFLGILILAIPILYTQNEWYDTAGSRWGALMAGALFSVSLRQYSLFQKKFRWVLSALLLATALQAMIALGQLFAPHWVPDSFSYPVHYHRPYGVFQQVNLLASFIATGLSLTLLMFFIPGANGIHAGIKRITNTLLALLILLFSAMLIWLQSRIGWLGGSTAALLMFIVGFRYAPKKARLALCLIGLGVGLALIVQWNDSVLSVSHSGSNIARVAILQDTLKMIADKPWSGWGYGGFEYSFQHYRASHHLSTLGLGVVRHPHNEVLLWWSEGGVVALCGMLVLMGAGIGIVWRAYAPSVPRPGSAKPGNPLPLALTGALIPILLHTQTEYPFTASAPHWAIVLMLAAMLAGQLSNMPRVAVQPRTIRWVRVPVTLFSLAALGLFSFGLYANLILTSVERQAFKNISHAQQAMKYDPWINRERWHYDEHLNDLMRFNETRNISSLYQYQHWAEHYLRSRIDRNVYGNLVGVLAWLKNAEKYRQIKEEAFIMFPDDIRFHTEATNSKKG